MLKFPDRWLDYTNTGDVIHGTRLITFKVPLKESFFSNNKNASEDSRFTPTTLLECMDGKELKLGLVIDLTFTSRYYDPEEFTNKGVQYQKIFVKGHVIPKKEVIDKFYETVDTFLENSDDDSLVGVHCTHGVNRTGYVVCRYMVERLGMKATEALEAYQTARGYPVERVNYINDLKRRSGEHVEEEEEIPNSEQESSSGGDKHKNNNHVHKRERGSYGGHSHREGSSNPKYRRRDHCQNGRWNENDGHQHYDQSVEQCENFSGQYSDQGAYDWYGNQHGADPTGYGYGHYHRYSTNNWRQQNQQYGANSDTSQNYYKGHHSAGGYGYYQYWDARSHQDWYNDYNGYNSHLHWNSYSGNRRNDSNDGRNYSRQNVSESRKEGRAKWGHERKRPY